MLHNRIIQSYIDQAHLSDDDIHKLLAVDSSIEIQSPYTGSEAWIDKLHEYRMNGKDIYIYADYDADGVCAGIIAYYSLLLMDFDESKIHVIEPRSSDGYGLSPKSVDRCFKSTEPGLIITADNGIAAKEGVHSAVELGFEVIVSDHHIQSLEKTPEDAAAIVDPNRVDVAEVYPFKGNSGTTVVWKLMKLYAKKYKTGKYDIVDQLVTIAGISTITDIMPAENENRYFMKVMRSNMSNHIYDTPEFSRNDKAYHIFAVLAYLSHAFGNDFNYQSIGYGLGPMLNSPRRVYEDSALAYDLFLNSSVVIAFMKLQEVNDTRKKLVANLSARTISAQRKNAESSRKIITEVDTSYTGLVGLVASKLVQSLHRPSIVITSKYHGGSGRSTPEVDLFSLLNAALSVTNLKDKVTFGGHAAALGADLHNLTDEEIDTLDAMMYHLMPNHTDNTKKPLAQIDVPLHLETLSNTDALANAVAWFDNIAPFGREVPAPIFSLDIDSDKTKYVTRRRGVNHAFTAYKNIDKLEIIRWQAPDSYFDELESTSTLKLSGSMNVNEWHGQRKINFVVQQCEEV